MSTYGLWLSAAGMKVNEHRQTVLANNMANTETRGFKHDMAMVRLRAVESREDVAQRAFTHSVLDDMPGGVRVMQPHTDFAQGPIEHTGRAMDVALQGEGFLLVGADGETRLTRDGRITVNRQGELVSSSGDGRWRVLSEANEPIRVRADGPEIKIGTDGTIRQGEETAGRLALRNPLDVRRLRKVGANLFELGEAQTQEARPVVIAEALEQSNFEVMRGLTEMIEVSRAYEMNATLLRMQDQASASASRIAQLS